MTKIPYTLSSFSSVVKRQARQGEDPTLVDGGVHRAVNRLKALRRDYLVDRKALAADFAGLAELRAVYTAKRRDLRTVRDEAVERALLHTLHGFEQEIQAASFSWGLARGPEIETKQTYTLPTDMSKRIPAKQVEAILRNLTGSPLSRHTVVNALKDGLNRPYPHQIIRKDVESFFESIPHTGLMDALSQDRRVDSITLHLVGCLLEEYRLLSGAPKGLPRGVGVSSYLAEFYMQPFDIFARQHHSVAFYCRYVDDIVIIFHHDTTKGDFEKILRTNLDDLKLQFSSKPSKNQYLIADRSGVYRSNKTLSYLGYVFEKEQAGALKVSLSDRRESKRKARLSAAFDDWLGAKPVRSRPNTGHDGLLLKRILFLASNSRLQYSKSDVTVGIFFSNQALSPDLAQLHELDNQLQEHIDTNRSRMSEELLRRIEPISFVEGFRNKTYIQFSRNDYRQIKLCWELIK